MWIRYKIQSVWQYKQIDTVARKWQSNRICCHISRHRLINNNLLPNCTIFQQIAIYKYMANFNCYIPKHTGCQLPYLSLNRLGNQFSGFRLIPVAYTIQIKHGNTIILICKMSN